jgi:hypothetical protein
MSAKVSANENISHPGGCALAAQQQQSMASKETAQRKRRSLR